jgi:hypothetical protein
MDEPEQAYLSHKATLFQAYVDLINSERETIWARHNALLVANSLIVGALALTPSAFGNGPLGDNRPHRCRAPYQLSLVSDHASRMVMRHAEITSDFTATHFKHLTEPLRRYHLSSGRGANSFPRSNSDRHVYPHLSWSRPCQTRRIDRGVLALISGEEGLNRPGYDVLDPLVGGALGGV